MKAVLSVLVAVLLVTPALADVGAIVEGARAVQVAQHSLDSPAAHHRDVTEGAVYSNVTNESGYVVTVGGVTLSTGTRITQMLADDVQCSLGGVPMVQFTFSVYNSNTTARAAQPLIRFYEDNSGAPGALLGGWNFNAITFDASSVGFYTADVAPAWNIPANGKMWVGIAFATTSGTVAQRNGFGIELVSPPDVGSSVDKDFLTTANGGTTITSAFMANNPAGAVRSAPYTNAPADHAFEIVVAQGACCVMAFPSCQILTSAACDSLGGTYLGDNSTCSDLDCNGNGRDDKCDLSSGYSDDCNGNGVPDECDIDAATSQDCQGDGIPDECQLDSAPIIDEGFDDITTLTTWNMQNLSSPVGTSSWFQGNPANFPSHSGADTSYISANYNSTGSTGTISNWLITPVLSLENGMKIDFYTRGPECTTCYADRLQVRMSLNGLSTNVGTTATSVGDFSTLLLDINPTLAASGYPQSWASGHYTITISGVPAPMLGRIAFRYFVTSGGASGANSNLIGIDTLKVIHAGPPADDCNGNGIPDECDIAISFGGFCDPAFESCDTDYNANGVPDDCEFCGDLTGDSIVDYADFQALLASFAKCVGNPAYNAAADTDGDGCVTLRDYQSWLVCYKMANGVPFTGKPKTNGLSGAPSTSTPQSLPASTGAIKKQ